MALTNPTVIGVAHGRHDRDLITQYRANSRPFIYWNATTATTGAWFVVDADATTDATTGITDRDNINGAIAAASALFTNDAMLIP